MNMKIKIENNKYNNQPNNKNKKKKRGSIDKKNKLNPNKINNNNINNSNSNYNETNSIDGNNINNNNFWDMNNDNDNDNNNDNNNNNENEEIISHNNLNNVNNINNINNYDNTLFQNYQDKENTYHFKNININKNINKQKKNDTFYDKYNNLLKNYEKEKNKKNKNKTDYRNNSVDMSKMHRKKNIKFDQLSVFERNQKWLKNKKEKLNKAIEKYINKKEKEFIENTIDYKMYKKKDIDINIVFNEEENVSYKKENYKFFMRLIQGRQERERAYDIGNSYAKINCLKKSHYSGRQNGNISQKEMNKYKKFIHNELKEVTN